MPEGGPAGGVTVSEPPDRDRDEVGAESEDDASGSFGAWTLVWTLVAMKIITIVIVILAARKAEAGTLFAVITWHWLVVLGALLAAPVLFRVRLRRMRSRREALMRAEWMVEDEVPIGVPVRSSRSGVTGRDVRVR
jgi:hypothetical protein